MIESIKYKPIWMELEDIINDVPGWSPIDQLYTLFQLAFVTLELQGDIVEIGSWCGRSALALGMAAKLTGNTKVHCIDLFPEKKDWEPNSDGSYSFTIRLDNQILGGHQEQTVWKEPFEKDISPLYEHNNSILEMLKTIKCKMLSFHSKVIQIHLFNHSTMIFNVNLSLLTVSTAIVQ